MVVMISGHGTIETAVKRDQAGRLRFHRKAADDRKGRSAGEECLPAAHGWSAKSSG